MFSQILDWNWSRNTFHLIRLAKIQVLKRINRCPRLEALSASLPISIRGHWSIQNRNNYIFSLFRSDSYYSVFCTAGLGCSLVAIRCCQSRLMNDLSITTRHSVLLIHWHSLPGKDRIILYLVNITLWLWSRPEKWPF